MSNLKLGINGFGRIGRIVFRATVKRDDVDVVAINDLLDVEHLAYLLKYDSVHGNFDGTVEVKDGHLVVDGKTVRVTAERDPKNLKWDEVGADVVAECTGIFTTLETADYHIQAGAKKVVISAPSKDAPMFVMGVNDSELTADHTIVSNASCTTNCLAPMAKIIEDNFSWDEEADEDRYIKKKQLAYKEEIAKARKFLDESKNKYYDEIKLRPSVTQEQKKATEFFNKYNEEQQRAENNHKDFVNKTNKLFNDFEGFNFDVGEKRFRYKM